MALCVPTEIEQVVLNILKNAAQAMATKQYTPPDGPTILLNIRQEPEQIVISIQDNGPGVDVETQKRMFEPFFTTKPVGEGTGLGLSVSYFILLIIMVAECGLNPFLTTAPPSISVYLSK